MANVKPRKRSKAPRNQRRRMWEIAGQLIGVPPLIAELTRRYHQALVAARRGDAELVEVNKYGLELATRGWVLANNTLHLKITKDARRARKDVALFQMLEIPRLSAHQIMAVAHAAAAANKHRRQVRETRAMAAARRLRQWLAELPGEPV